MIEARGEAMGHEENTMIVPFLRSGTGQTPAEGGCILQVIDWIDRMEWTDKPPCVHPVIAKVAISVNDHLPDDERQKLLDLGPRIMGTAGGDKALTRKLLAYLARQVYPIYSTWAERNGYDDHGSVLACIVAAERGEAAKAAEAARAAEAAEAAWAARAGEAAEAARAAEAAEAAWAAWAAEAGVPAPFTLLVGLLDRYDELTGRTQIKPLDYEPVARAMAGERL